MGADRGFELNETSSETVYCARHPDVETYLRCNRCNTPICPRCLVQTPVGARCPDCARVSRLPTVDITPVAFARASGAALVSGLAVGWFWELITPRFGFGYLFSVLIGLGVGWVISEAVSFATNRKLGLGVQINAVLGVAVAFGLYQLLRPGTVIFETEWLALGAAAVFAVIRLKAR